MDPREEEFIKILNTLKEEGLTPKIITNKEKYIFTLKEALTTIAINLGYKSKKTNEELIEEIRKLKNELFPNGFED